MLEVQNLVKSFGKRRVLEEVSFVAREGELITLLGPNGAGKTTLMRLICSYLAPDAGTVRINGKSYETSRTDILRNLGYMPENAPLYKELTVFEYLRFIGEIFSLGKKEFARAFEEVCAGLELQPVLGQKIQTLSKGYTRRTGIAAAMLHRPRLLVLDEPTEGLDPNQKTAVRKYLRRCAEKALVLISTHLLEEAEMLNSRVLLLADGTICRDTTVEGLRACSRDGTLADAFHRLTAEEKTATEDEQ